MWFSRQCALRLRRDNRTGLRIARLKSSTRLPPEPFELRVQVLLLRPAEKKIADEFPVWRRAERLCNLCRIDNGYPAKPKAGFARREPQHRHHAGARMIERLRHRMPAETVALQCVSVGKHRKMQRRRVKSRELQAIIKVRLLTIVGFGRAAPRFLEIPGDCGPALRRLHVDDPPRLAVADGWREIGQPQKPIDQLLGHRIPFEPANIAAPADKLLERRSFIPVRVVIRLAESHLRKCVRSGKRQCILTYSIIPALAGKSTFCHTKSRVFPELKTPYPPRDRF